MVSGPIGVGDHGDPESDGAKGTHTTMVDIAAGYAYTLRITNTGSFGACGGVGDLRQISE